MPIMPEDTPHPYRGRRLRVFMSGYNVKDKAGNKTGDHVIGLAWERFQDNWTYG